MQNTNSQSNFLSSNFDEAVLYAPARSNSEHPCNSLKVVTAFTDCERISTHAIALADGIKSDKFLSGITIDIILGMTKSSLSVKKHQNICRLLEQLNKSNSMPKVTCKYICSGAEVHSKIYVWNQHNNNSEIPYIAYCGSLNYTMNAFYKRRESVSICDSISAYNYYSSLLPDTIDCFDPLVFDKLKNISNNSPENIEDIDNTGDEYQDYDLKTPIATLKVSLLKADGSDTGYGSGINWGIRQNGTRRNPNQAYIPYNSKDKMPGFFPDRLSPSDKNCPIFKVITKDFGSFHMRMAQQGNKALHSAENNSILGEWIRKRIGAPQGGYVTKQMLELYGKTYVTFRKYADGTYLLDF